MGKQLDLKYGLTFAQLYAREGLVALDRNFCAWLQEGSVELFNKLMQARQSYPSRGDEAKLLTALAPYVEDFIGELFDIEKEIADLRGRHQALANIFHCKRQFVQRFAAKKYGAEEAALFNGNALRNELEKLFGEKLTQDSYVKHVHQWGREPEKLDVAARYAAWAAHTVEGRHYHKADILFRLPKKIDFQHLIPVVTEEWQGVTRYKLPDSYLRVRHGFGLTDSGGDLTYALDQAHYCIFCHEQDKDSCRKGLPDKTIPGAYKKSEGGIELAGCPLDEKISEMNFTKAEGNSIGALA
ncbi:MAG: pyridine nucleotide-disulfide oxidoreductase, partial [Dongiaceae bacterium]